MTNEATIDNAAATASTEAPATTDAGVTEQTTTTEVSGEQLSNDISTNETPDFALPDEYKDKSWADKVKSQEDAYKQIDNLTTLVGKKTIQPIDYDTATPEQIEEHYKGLAPEETSSYEFGENSSPEITAPMAELFQKAGIDVHQQKIVTDGFDKLMETMATGQDTKAADGAEYVEMLKTEFGAGYEAEYAKLNTAIGTYANKDDLALLRDGIPNTTKMALDRTLNNILKAHGASESGSQGEGESGGNIAVDKTAQMTDINKQIDELVSRPHTAAQKQELINKRHEIFSKR